MARIIQILTLSEEVIDRDSSKVWGIFDDVCLLMTIVKDHNDNRNKNHLIKAIKSKPRYSNIQIPKCDISDYTLYHFNDTGLNGIDKDSADILGLSILDVNLLNLTENPTYPLNRKPVTVGEYFICAMLFSTKFGFEYGCLVGRDSDVLKTTKENKKGMIESLGIRKIVNNPKDLKHFFIDITIIYLLIKEIDLFYNEIEEDLSWKFDYET